MTVTLVVSIFFLILLVAFRHSFQAKPQTIVVAREEVRDASPDLSE